MDNIYGEIKEVHNKISETQTDINEIKITLSVNTQSLLDHMKRSDLLEVKMTGLEKMFIQLQGAGKLLGFILLVVSIVVAIKGL